MRGPHRGDEGQPASGARAFHKMIYLIFPPRRDMFIFLHKADVCGHEGVSASRGKADIN